MKELSFQWYKESTGVYRCKANGHLLGCLVDLDTLDPANKTDPLSGGKRWGYHYFYAKNQQIGYEEDFRKAQRIVETRLNELHQAAIENAVGTGILRGLLEGLSGI
jgi:hypothetical protein